MGIVSLMVAAFLFLRKENIELPPEPQRAPVRAPAPPAQVSHPIATPVRASEPGKLALPATAEEHLNPAGLQIMREALRTFQSLELERRQFPTNSFGEVILDGIQRKLFLDDYTYAKVLSGADCSEGESVLENLREQIAKLDDRTIQEDDL